MTSLETSELRELSARQAARELGIGDERMRAILEAGEIPEAYRTDGGRVREGRWAIPRWAIREFQARRGQEQREAAEKPAATR